MLGLTTMEQLQARLVILQKRHNRVCWILRPLKEHDRKRPRLILNAITKDLRRCRRAISEFGSKTKREPDGWKPRPIHIVKKTGLPKHLIGFTVLRELPFEDLYTTYKDHRRLSVFVQKGLKCTHPGCERIAERLILTVDRGGGKHADVYTKDFHLMNVDHIIPKSKGGGEEMENKQPMCEQHNSWKSNKMPNELFYNNNPNNNTECKTLINNSLAS